MGRFQDNQGSRVVMALGSLLMGSGLLVIAMAKRASAVFHRLGLCGAGFAALSLYNASLHLARANVRPQCAPAIVLLTLIGGLASSIVWPSPSVLLNVLDWRSLVLIFGAVNILLCAPLHAWLLDGRERQLDGEPLPEPVPPGLKPEGQATASC